ncbi:hypothetical protein DM01DRAFT_1373592 [Hesseltinella vesiculosa]|uniref:Uncharacterized protein n=1 Tax=Hesseltinella vesiculosa TaxID=101127 RepID=A0A1X2GJ34_9FUNG|nr:hypothetical protein DM01DRAFT_1373592 [Hesseltinella vesiculosa]
MDNGMPMMNPMMGMPRAPCLSRGNQFPHGYGPPLDSNISSGGSRGTYNNDHHGQDREGRDRSRDDGDHNGRNEGRLSHHHSSSRSRHPNSSSSRSNSRR